MKLNDLERHLRANGCVKKRDGGNHTIWDNPSNGKIAPVPRHREIKEGLVKKICKELDIPSP
jgi:mRNA interferase HicA